MIVYTGPKERFKCPSSQYAMSFLTTGDTTEFPGEVKVTAAPTVSGSGENRSWEELPARALV